MNSFLNTPPTPRLHLQPGLSHTPDSILTHKDSAFMRNIPLPTLLALIGVTAACAQDTDTPAEEAADSIAESAEAISETIEEAADEAAEEIDEAADEMTDAVTVDDDEPEVVTTDSGLQYQDIVVGDGPSPVPGDRVTVHYTGTLTDGTVFDSSVERGQPFSFTLGVGQVIRGWDEGVASMRVGGTRILTIPPELGYGQRDLGEIPPNSTLIFEVELLGIN